MPSTNNCTKARVKYTRLDAGAIAGNIAECMTFILQQVEHDSQTPFDVLGQRPVRNDVWTRAVDFANLSHTNCVQAVDTHASTFYCTAKRLHATDVAQRPPLNRDRALAMVACMFRRQAGGETTAEELEDFETVRIFGFRGQRAICTCPAFRGPRTCFHVLALRLHLGLVHAPKTADATPVATGARGNKRRPLGRGSVPLAADEKDKRIVELEKQLAVYKRRRGTTGP